MFPAGEEKEPSFEEFTQNYLKGTALASSLAKESIVAGKLQKVVSSKSYDEIERIF
jgi:hypothetical protein